MITFTEIERKIEKGNQLAFLHLHKTAGTSLNIIIEAHFSKKEVYPEYHREDVIKHSLNAFDQYRYFRGHFPYDLIYKMTRGQTHWLTILRDPIERYISQFFFLQQKPVTIPFHYRQATPDDIVAYKSMSLYEFVNASDFSFLISSQNLQARWLVTTLDIDPIDEWLHAFDNTLSQETDLNLDLGKQRLDGFAFVGLTERFQNSHFLLSYIFGWPPILNYANLNVTAGKPKRDKISPEVLDSIVKLNESDLVLYAHAQQLFDKRYTRMTHALLEQYGNRRHAQLKPPLSPDVLFELLENHYEQRYAERNLPERRIHFTFDQGILGNGWYAVEEHPQHGNYRWTGPGKRSTIDVPLTLDADDYRIEFSIAAAITPEILSSFKLWVNEELIPLEKGYNQADEPIFCGVIHHSKSPSIKPFIRLTFEVRKTTAPITLDPSIEDERPLGLALDRLDIFPVEETGWFQEEIMLNTDFNGERYIPALDWPEISYEHWHRYLFASHFVVNKSVLDIGCGDGYGSNLLSDFAQNVVGMDADSDVIRRAAKKYRKPNLVFCPGSAQDTPFGEKDLFDTVICFETIEHLTIPKQLSFLSEVKRVLKPHGVLVISTPNKESYREESSEENKYHRHELTVGEFEELLNRYFRIVQLFGQRVYPVSYLWPLQSESRKGFTEHQLTYRENNFQPIDGDNLDPLYALAICSDEVLPVPQVSLLIDVCSQAIERREQQITSLHAELQLQESQARDAYNHLSTIYQEASDWAHSLESDLQVKIREILDLNQKLIGKDQELLAKDQELQATDQELQAKDQDLPAKEQELQAKDQELQAKNQELQAKDQELQAKNQELQTIYTSRAWRFTQKIQNIYNWFRNIPKL